MAELKFRVQADYDKVQRLREEISKLKQEIKGVGAIQDPTAFNVLNAKLQDLAKQYDSLVAKAAEADAKIMESAARMDKAVDSITKAHEKAEKAAIKQTSSTGIKTQAEAVEGQAKAYLDLKDEIDAILGTRERNIRQMMKEQNAIKLINAEIVQINKSRQSSGRISQTQAQRLQTLNGDLLMHRQALAEVRQELANNAKLDLATVGSMNELSQSLSRMRIAYRALNEGERNSEFGQNLLKSIQEADAKIKELDATIGNHQRNVGNYQGSFNGLNMSVQQIVRELPAAKMGINMFFMAISNNLPVMVDQIKLAKEANKTMKEAGQEPVPVWRQLVSSLFSWQSAMMVGITLLTVYGKDIVNWVKELFKANDAQEQARKEAEAFTKTVQKAHEEWRNSVAQTAARQITEYRKMQREWNKLGNDLNAKKKYVNANKDAFHQLGFAVNGVSDAERVMTGNTDAVVASIMARAKASAYYAQMQEATERYIKQTEHNKGTIAGGGYYKKVKVGDIINKHTEYQSTGTGVVGVQVGDAVTAANVNQINAERQKEAAKTLAANQKKAKAQLDKQLNSLQDGLESAIKENQGLLKEIGVAEYKDYKDQKEKKEKVGKQIDYDKMRREQSDAERNLENSVTQSRIDAMQEGYEKEKAQRELNHKKELEDIDKQRRDFLQRKRDDAKRVFEADPKNKGKKFNASSVTLSTADNAKFDEMLTNIKTKHANEYKELEVQRLQALYDYLKEYGTVQQQMYAIAKEYDEKIAKEKDENRKKLLEKEKSSALAKSNASSLALDIDWGATFGGIGGVLKDIAKETLKEIEQYMRTAEFKALSPADKKAYTDLRDKLRGEGAGAATSPFKFSQWGEIEKQTRAYQESVRNLKEKTNAHAKAVDELNAAEKLLANATTDSTRKIAQAAVDAARVKVDTTADDLNNAKEDKDNKHGELTDSTNKAIQGLNNFSSALQQMSNGTLKGFADGIANLISSIGGKSGVGGLIGTIGGKAGGLIGAILQIIDALGDEPAAFIKGLLDKVAKVVETVLQQIPYIILDIIKGVGNIIGGIIGGIGSWFVGGGNEKDMEKEISKLTKANEKLAQTIEELSKSISKKDNTNKQSLEAYKKAKEAEDEWEANQRKAIANRASEWTNKGYGFMKLGGKSSFNAHSKSSDWWGWEEFNKRLSESGSKARVFSSTDMWKLSPDEMKTLQEAADTAWREFFDNGGHKSPEDLVKEYIERSGKREELASVLNEKLTGYSWDGFMDSYKSTLKNLESTTEDFANNINEIISNALIESFSNEELKPKIKELYEYIAKAAEDGLDDGEIAYIRKKNDEIAALGLKKRSELEQAGLIKKKDSEQNASANGVTTITFEQANNIVALTTAGNISRDQIKERLSLMNATMDDIRALMSQTFSSTPDYANSNRAIINNSYTPQIQVSFPKEELQNINGKIGTILAVVDEMRTHGVESLMEQKALSRDTEKIVMGNKEMLSCVNDFRRDFNKQY